MQTRRSLLLSTFIVVGLLLGWAAAAASPAWGSPGRAATRLTAVSLPPAWTLDGEQKGAEFGCAAAGIGDVNGDGYDDVLFGASRYTGAVYREGAALLFYGGSGGLQTQPDWLAAGGQKGAEFGATLAPAGDVNRDGYADFLIGAPLYNGELTLTVAGGAFLYLGSEDGPAATPDWAQTGDQQDAQFGAALGGAGDVNGDGYGDVIIGAPRYANDEDARNQGRVFLYSGGAGGLALEPAWTLENYQPNASLGKAAGAAGDVNGDGFADVFVGAPNFDMTLEDEGAVFVFYGSPGGLKPEPDWSAFGGQTGAWLGQSAVTAGDVDGDGYDDLLVGAPYYPNGLLGNGRVFLYRGGPGGLAAQPSWSAYIRQSYALYGWNVAGGGDINYDGYADVVVGAHHYDDDQPDEGGLFVYYGSPAGLSAAPLWLATGDKADTDFAYGLALAGDINGDGHADVAAGAPRYFLTTEPMGRLFLYLGLADDALPDPTMYLHLPVMVRMSSP